MFASLTPSVPVIAEGIGFPNGHLAESRVHTTPLAPLLSVLVPEALVTLRPGALPMHFQVAAIAAPPLLCAKCPGASSPDSPIKQPLAEIVTQRLAVPCFGRSVSEDRLGIWRCVTANSFQL